MHLLGIVGSMRKDKYTNALVNQVINDIKIIDPGCSSEVVYIFDKSINSCKVICSKFCAENPYQCLNSDYASEILNLMIKADAIIIGAPLYFRGAPTKFQTLIEKIISIFFYYETNGKAINKSPVKDKPCGLIGMAEYSNPHQILEYLHDFCCLLNMKAIKIEKFPYIGVCGQGDINKDKIFNPFERSKDLANAIIKEWKSNE